ncbi:MAG: hypothetical protein HC814_02795 [Rhodobacteraceae bacterium]|nr:hypothetical protein [Paracoccaceae bacterium]
MREREVNELIEENERLRRENELLRQKLDLLARRIFGRKSEQLDSNQLEFLLGKLNEPESSLPASGDAAIPEADAKPRRPSKTPQAPQPR